MMDLGSHIKEHFSRGLEYYGDILVKSNRGMEGSNLVAIIYDDEVPIYYIKTALDNQSSRGSAFNELHMYHVLENLGLGASADESFILSEQEVLSCASRNMMIVTSALENHDGQNFQTIKDKFEDKEHDICKNRESFQKSLANLFIVKKYWIFKILNKMMVMLGY